MKNKILPIAMKWAGIQFLLSWAISFSIAQLMLSLQIGDYLTTSVVPDFFGLAALLVLSLLALRDLEQKIGPDMGPGRAFALFGWMLLALVLVGVAVILLQHLIGVEALEGNLRDRLIIHLLNLNPVRLVFVYSVALFAYSLWRVFVKAGKPGWASLVPVYNSIVCCEIGGRPTWWVAMLFIPFVNIVFGVMIVHGISKAFGKDQGFTAGLIFLPFVFYPLLAFGPATDAPAAVEVAGPSA